MLVLVTCWVEVVQRVYSVSCWQCSKIWASKTINQSTLAAKTLSLVEAAENTFLLANIIEDILSQIDKLHITCFIDSKGLYDAVNTTNITSDKQLKIEMAVVREMVDNKEIKLELITKDYHLADMLTKKATHKSP